MGGNCFISKVPKFWDRNISSQRRYICNNEINRPVFIYMSHIVTNSLGRPGKPFNYHLSFLGVGTLMSNQGVQKCQRRKTA